MLIVGAKGFAKEVLQILYQRNEIENVCFFDDISDDSPDYLYGTFKVIKNIENVKDYFNDVDNRFTLGVGQPKIRENLSKLFQKLDGQLTSVISPKADVGVFNTQIGDGVNIMTGSVITNDITISEGCLINKNCTIGHDTKIGIFTELSPGVHISGNCTIGEYCFLGTGAVVLPKICIGNNVTVAAGAVVTKNIDDNQTVIGIPARPLKFK